MPTINFASNTAIGTGASRIPNANGIGPVPINLHQYDLAMDMTSMPLGTVIDMQIEFKLSDGLWHHANGATFTCKPFVDRHGVTQTINHLSGSIPTVEGGWLSYPTAARIVINSCSQAGTMSWTAVIT